MKTMIATAVVLVACAGSGLLAADTNTVVAASVPKISVQNNSGYFNPVRSHQSNPYPYANIVGGESFGPSNQFSLPDQNESPFNPPAGLTRHRVPASRLNSPVTSPTLRQPATRIAPVRKTQPSTTPATDSASPKVAAN